MAMPLGGGRRKGGKLTKHDFIYDARLELGGGGLGKVLFSG